MGSRFGLRANPTLARGVAARQVLSLPRFDNAIVGNRAQTAPASCAGDSNRCRNPGRRFGLMRWRRAEAARCNSIATARSAGALAAERFVWHRCFPGGGCGGGARPGGAKRELEPANSLHRRLAGAKFRHSAIADDLAPAGRRRSPRSRQPPNDLLVPAWALSRAGLRRILPSAAERRRERRSPRASMGSRRGPHGNSGSTRCRNIWMRDGSAARPRGR